MEAVSLLLVFRQFFEKRSIQHDDTTQNKLFIFLSYFNSLLLFFLSGDGFNLRHKSRHAFLAVCPYSYIYLLVSSFSYIKLLVIIALVITPSKSLFKINLIVLPSIWTWNRTSKPQTNIKMFIVILIYAIDPGLSSGYSTIANTSVFMNLSLNPVCWIIGDYENFELLSSRNYGRYTPRQQQQTQPLPDNS